MGRDPETFDSLEAVEYIDSIYARVFDEIESGNFTSDDNLIKDMQLMLNRQFNYILTNN